MPLEHRYRPLGRLAYRVRLVVQHRHQGRHHRWITHLAQQPGRVPPCLTVSVLQQSYQERDRVWIQGLLELTQRCGLFPGVSIHAGPHQAIDISAGLLDGATLSGQRRVVLAGTDSRLEEERAGLPSARNALYELPHRFREMLSL